MCYRAISWGRCLLIGLPVVISVVVVLVLPLFSFPVDEVGACPLVLCGLLLFSGSVCVLSSSASMKSDHLYSVVTV